MLMPNRLMKQRLFEFYEEQKFQQALSIYYPGLDNERLRAALSEIINNTILEVYSKIDLSLLRYELIDIIQKGLYNFHSFNLNQDDMLYVRQYYNRIILTVDWDLDPITFNI